MYNEVFVADLLSSPYTSKDFYPFTPSTADALLDKENPLTTTLTVKREQWRYKKSIKKVIEPIITEKKTEIPKYGDGPVTEKKPKGTQKTLTATSFDLNKQIEGLKKLPR